MPVVDTTRCTGCGLCVQACPTGAMRIVNDVAMVAEALCERHGACIRACPQEAIRWAEGESPTASLPAVQQPDPKSVSRPQPVVAKVVKRAWLPAVGTALVTLGQRLLPYAVDRIGDIIERKLASTPTTQQTSKADLSPTSSSVTSPTSSGSSSSTTAARGGAGHRHRRGRGGR